MNTPPTLAIELFRPDPNTLYDLDAAARLAGVPRRSILIYCHAGLVSPVFQSPYGVMAFTEDSIHIVRRIEYIRAVHGNDITWIKTVFGLLDEVTRLRAELRFVRNP